jgi:PIN domain nuclease of toxin-antitoxin system
MKVLLDTCAILWCVSEPSRLSTAARGILARPDTEVSFSPISAAEIACLSQRGRITLDRHWRSWLTHFTSTNGWRALDIGLDTLFEAYSLPDWEFQDPADRIIMGTARQHGLTIVTGDRRILDYPHVTSVS